MCVTLENPTFRFFTRDVGGNGKANLKVWTRGRWASEQEVDTATAVKDELTVRVTATKDSGDSKDAKETAE